MAYTKKSVDLWALFKDSLKFIWNYKALWLVGFVLALVTFEGGSASVNNFSNNSYSVQSIELPEGIEDKVTRATDDFRTVATSVSFIVGMVILTCVGIVITVVSIYARITSRNAIINVASSEEKLKVGPLWKSGHKAFWKIFLVDILYGVGTLILFVVSAPLICLCGLGILTMFVGGLVLGLMQFLTIRFVLLDDKKIMEAIEESWNLVSANWSNFIVVQLLLWLIELAKGVVFALVAIISIVAILLVIGILIAINIPWITVIVIFVMAVIAWIVTGVMKTPFVLQEEVFKTKVFNALVK